MNIFEIKQDIFFVENDNDIYFLKNKHNINAISEGVLFNFTYKTYIVQPTDTFEKVCKKLNLTRSQFEEIVKNKNLFVGQKIEYDL